MIFIKLKENKTDIDLIHYMPFDLTYGLGKTKEELDKEGIFVDFIPIPGIIKNKNAVLKWNGTGFYYVYEDSPKSETEVQQYLIDQLILDNLNMQSQIDDLIITNLA